MLGRVPSPDLAVYVVWLPVLEKDDEAAARAAAARIADPRARHYWNPDLEVAHAAARALAGRPAGPAWDVFLLHEAGVRWSAGELPPPTAWMHRQVPGHPRWMEPESLMRAVRALLPEPSPTPRR